MFYLIALACGTVFGLGLAVSGMINPAKVINFLDVAGHWDPTLAVVFAGALATAFPAYQWALRQSAGPLFAEKFQLPASREITPALLGGAMLFGVGWGLGGFCPGPGLAALATRSPGAIVFVLGMFAGAAFYRYGIER